ncbi:hypothetical protein A4G19_04420 [Pasteurellaceae bacterium Macca]|nr:hypothetical protein [Pasteurellaceae bacterium Macca]
MAQQFLFSQLAVGALETAFNQLIKRSPHVAPQLRKLKGKILHIQLTAPHLSLFVIFSEQRSDWLTQYEGDADCAITLESTVLPKLADKSKLSELINQKQLLLTGDIQVLQHFNTLLDELEKNPAELLSPLLGDVLAQFSTDIASHLFGKIKQHTHTQAQYLVDNLMTERPVLVHTLEFVHFSDEVALLAEQAVKFEEKFAQREKELKR